MSIIRSIHYNTENKNISKILIEGKINVILYRQNEIFEYEKTDGTINKIIVVEFNYKEKIVKQAFYQCSGKYKGTWLPFDGIKADVDDNNKFYTFLDTSQIKDHPFGVNELKSVSYVLGGGVWKNSDSEFVKKLKVDPRISYFDGLDTKTVKFEDLNYINHYINYSITDNYLDYKPVKWLDGEELNSAFRFSSKMKNEHQIEYCPVRVKGAKNRSDYTEIYAKIDNSIVEIKQEKSNCTIL